MKTLGIEFVPAVMTILGNMGERLIDLIKRLAALPTIDSASALHPPQQPIMLSEEQKYAATVNRYKCLIAAAHANALAKTLAYSLSKKTSKSAARYSRASPS